MKIIRNAKTVFSCPTELLANNITAGIIRRRMKRKGIHLTGGQTRLFIKELKSYKKSHPNWHFIEITQKNGDTVTIML